MVGHDDDNEKCNMDGTDSSQIYIPRNHVTPQQED
jgi:hypothetical protein